MKNCFTTYAENFKNYVSHPQSSYKVDSNERMPFNSTNKTNYNKSVIENSYLNNENAKIDIPYKIYERESSNLFVNNMNSIKAEEKNTKIRYDRNGVLIVKGSKKHKAVFIDKVKGRGNFLVEKIDIESFKIINRSNTFTDGEDKNSSNFGNCCILF